MTARPNPRRSNADVSTPIPARAPSPSFVEAEVRGLGRRELRRRELRRLRRRWIGALLGRRDAAGEALLEAVERGFREFETMRRDPDLASMRDHETFTAILEAKDRVVEKSDDRRMTAFKERYADGYVQERDERRKLMIATGLGGRAHAEMMASSLPPPASSTITSSRALTMCTERGSR